jgi:hypothetical protein
MTVGCTGTVMIFIYIRRENLILLYMPTVVDPELYDKARQHADTVYSKPSAYKSGFIIKTYKKMGGRFREDNQPKALKTWFKEKWQDVGNKDYPVYRPTIRVNKNTPLTVQEIQPSNLKKQIDLKQKYRGLKNLPPFKRLPS